MEGREDCWGMEHRSSFFITFKKNEKWRWELGMKGREGLGQRAVIHTAPKCNPYVLCKISLWSKESEMTQEPFLQVDLRHDLLVEAETFTVQEKPWLGLLSLQRPSSL